MLELGELAIDPTFDLRQLGERVDDARGRRAEGREGEPELARRERAGDRLVIGDDDVGRVRLHDVEETRKRAARQGEQELLPEELEALETAQASGGIETGRLRTFVVEGKELGPVGQETSGALGVAGPGDAVAARGEVARHRDRRVDVPRERGDDEEKSLHATRRLSRPRQNSTVRALTSSVASQRTECEQSGSTSSVHRGMYQRRGALSWRRSERSP